MEKEKNNKVLIVVLLVIIILLGALCALFATGTISLNFKTENNGAANNIEETTALTKTEAISIVKKLYNNDVRDIYNQAIAYCGERESGEGAYLSMDGFNYTKSKSFKTLGELENHLKKYMTESLLLSSNYNKSVVLDGKTIKNYVEKDGVLYCNGWNKGSNMELAYYIENESTFEINNIGETSFEANINAVYYDVDYETNKDVSTKTEKKINVSVVKQNGNWLLDKYSELS